MENPVLNLALDNIRFLDGKLDDKCTSELHENWKYAGNPAYLWVVNVDDDSIEENKFNIALRHDGNIEREMIDRLRDAFILCTRYINDKYKAEMTKRTIVFQALQKKEVSPMASTPSADNYEKVLELWNQLLRMMEVVGVTEVCERMSPPKPNYPFFSFFVKKPLVERCDVQYEADGKVKVEVLWKNKFIPDVPYWDKDVDMKKTYGASRTTIMADVMMFPFDSAKDVNKFADWLTAYLTSEYMSNLNGEYDYEYQEH